MNDTLLGALFDGKTLVSSDNQFRLRLEMETSDAPILQIQHCSTTSHWRYVKTFELEIIRYNSWRVLDEV